MKDLFSLNDEAALIPGGGGVSLFASREICHGRGVIGGCLPL
jgi:hypothetical protein